MISSDSLPPPQRGLRVNINDLLNPIRPSATDTRSPGDVHQAHSAASSPGPSAHTTILPAFSTILPREHHTNDQLYPQSGMEARSGPSARGEQAISRTPDGGRFKITKHSGNTHRANHSEAHFGLRSAQWIPADANSAAMRPVLPPLQPMRDLKIEPPQASPFSASPRERDYVKDNGGVSSRRRMTLPSPPSPASPRRVVSSVTGSAVSRSNTSPAILEIPHSPYGRQQQRPHQATHSAQPALYGPQAYAHQSQLVERPVIRQAHWSVMSSPDSSPKNEYNAHSASSINMGALDTSALNAQAAERVSARHGSKIPTPLPSSMCDDEPTSILQLHPAEQAHQPGRHRKRTRSGAGLDTIIGGSSTARSPSLSSSSTEHSTGSGNGESEYDDAIKAKKVRGRFDHNSAGGDISKRQAKTTKAHSVPEDAASDASGSAKLPRKGKTKEKLATSTSQGHANGHVQPYDPQMTMSLGYGVGVVPVREGSPVYPFGFAPYAVPMHMHPLGMPVALAAAQNQPYGGRWFPELQYARCMSARYKADPFPRCVSCTRRWAGDTCRFQNIRILLRDSNKTLWAVGFQDLSAKTQGPHLIYPEQWNVPLEKRHISRIMGTVAMSLLPHLRKEQAHQHFSSVVRRQRETDVRATCDTCMTSLFSSSWMCRQCGREACEECFETIRRLTADPTTAANSAPNGKQKSPSSPTDQRTLKERHAQANPFFLSCNRKAEHGVHTFVPVTRFSKTELDAAVSEMEKFEDGSHVGGVDARTMEIDTSPVSPPSSHLETRPKRSNSDSMQGQGLQQSLIPEYYNDGVCMLVENPIPPPASDAAYPSQLPPTSETPLETPTWPVPYYTAESLTETVFATQWARGTPLVVTGLLGRMKLPWTPEYFINTYGAQSCIIIECQTDANKKVTIGEFFNSFGKYEGRKECWKLKDWPPSTDFKSSFPELYDDFNQAVPVPSYTRRDGAYNIASHFPTNTVAPDLGPKMYNAYASSDTPGSKGSTRLHMDMADAVNIMLHAEATPDGAPGCAAWDIFRAEDSSHLRAFFKKNFKGQYQNDPIHAQQFYLDSTLRAQLFAEYGVRSFRIYQRPGEAVFIPAGCAHQVCNLSDSIKVACDFVSPENVERCETLTREFRAQNQSLVWKEDVLQLRSMMWFAWLSCRQQQDKWKDQDIGLESAVAQTSISGGRRDDDVMEAEQ